ncbi:MAG: MFS transporter [SAR202 cluster bacterium]|nr:MFS transporter [SAR202 cluster bacterium]
MEVVIGRQLPAGGASYPLNVNEPQPLHRSEDHGGGETEDVRGWTGPVANHASSSAETPAPEALAIGRPNPFSNPTPKGAPTSAPAASSVRRRRKIRVQAAAHTFESFKHRNFRFVWASTFFSSDGFWLQQIVIGWLTYDITQSAFLTTLAMGLDAFPILFIGPMGGLLVDKLERRLLLAGVLTYQATITLTFAVIVWTGMVETPYIFAYILMMGLAWVILDPARMSLIPNSVPKENLVNAFALNSLGFSATRLAAPAMGGAVLALVGPGPALVIEASLQLTAMAAALSIRLPKVDRGTLKLSSAFNELLEGARYVKAQPVVLSAMILGILPPLISFPYVSGLMPVFAAEVFYTGSVGLGLLMSSLGAGSVIGTLLLASLGDVKRKGRLITVAVVCTGCAMLGFSFVRSLAWALPALALVSVGMMLFFAGTSALIQSIVSDEFRGRVSSLYSLTFGALPVGSFLAGSMAQKLGAPSATLIASVVLVSAALMFTLWNRALWRAG